MPRTPGKRSRWGRLLLIVALALIVRTVALTWVGRDRLAFGDARDYLAAAGQLCQTGTYPMHGNLPFFRAPGLPLVIAAVTLCHPERVWLVKLWLAVFDATTVLVIFALGTLLLPCRRLARLAALAAAVYPVFVAQVTDVRTEPLFMLLLSSALLFFFAARSEPRARPLVLLALAGACLGLAALTRPSALLGIPFFAVAWLVDARSARSRVAGALVLAAAAAAVLTPWVVRNALASGELLMVNDAGGYAVWRGTHPEIRSILASKSQQEYRARVRHFQTETQARAAAAVAARASTPAARSREWLALEIERLRAHPGDTAAILGSNLARYWRPWLSPLEHSPLAVGLSAAVLVPFLLLGGAGVLMLLIRDRRTGFIVLSWLIVSWLARAPFQVVMRFRIPYADPLLLILGVAAAAELVRTGHPGWARNLVHSITPRRRHDRLTAGEMRPGT